MSGKDQIEKEAKRADIVAEVRELFPEKKFPTPVLEPMYYGRLQKKNVERRFLVLDKDTGTQFDIVSDEYHLIWHEEMVKSILDSCPEEYGRPKISVSILNKGATCAVGAFFPETGDYKVNGSKIEPGVKMFNSINRTRQLEFMFGAMELVCTNGLMRFKNKVQQRFKHMNGSLEKFVVESEIKNAMVDFSEQNEIWNKWVNIQIGTPEVEHIMEALPFSEKEVGNMMELRLLNHDNISLTEMLAKRKTTTLWAVNSAATQYARHNVKSELRAEYLESDIGNKMMDLWMKMAS